MFTLSLNAIGVYRPIDFSLLLKQGKSGEKIGLFVAWLTTCVVCIFLGLASVQYKWYSLPITLGGLDNTLSLYPPLPICLILVMLFGYVWGAIPAYLSTLILSLHVGMPTKWALLFAFANPVGLGIFAIVYRALPIQISLRDYGAILFFVLVSFFSSIASSAGIFIWSYTYKLDTLDVFSLWQGWWLGGFIQKVFIVGPILLAIVPTVESWKRDKIWIPQPRELSRAKILALSSVIIGSVFLFTFLAFNLTRKLYHEAISTKDYNAITKAFAITLHSSQAVYWILCLTVIVVAVLGYQFSSLWLMTLTEAKEKDVRNAERLAGIDALTEIPNRRQFDDVINKEWRRAQRTGEPVGLIMMDIDHFKGFNDFYGHPTGDECLKKVAQTLTHSLERTSDFVVRYGGEEFAAILPGTSETSAIRIAEKIRANIESQNIPNAASEISDHVTLSLGVALLIPAKETFPRNLIEIADKALYQAKKNGRNRVEFIAEQGA